MKINIIYNGKDNKLFFASDGHFGIGGLDLFVTELSLNEDKSTEITDTPPGRPDKVMF